MSNRNLGDEILDAIAAAGFDVYTPYGQASSYLFYTDGSNIGYMQREDWGGLSLSTVNIPNRECGTGFRITDDNSPPLALTRESLSQAFMIPHWASARDRAAVTKWPSVEKFIASNRIVPLALVRSKKESK